MCQFRKDLKFPILYGVAEVLQGKREVRDGMVMLMLNPMRTEVYDNWP